MQLSRERRSQDERSGAMRARLIGAARTLFLAKGYAATGTPEITAAAGVTRGALYHHFADKADLFRAVVAAEAEALAEGLRNIPAGRDALRQGSAAWFAAMALPGRAQLLLRDGPSVLGPDAMAGIDGETGVAALRAGLAPVTGLADGPVLDALADVISAGFDRAALAIAGGAEARPYHDALSMLLDRLSAPRR
jgi:AcrR family transcriptional regulator